MISLLPTYNRLLGVVTQKRLIRLLSIYLLLVLFGSNLFFFSQSTFWKIFGMGLILPGGGFFGYVEMFSLQNVRPILGFLIANFMFIAALGVWFGTGNIFVPPLVWLLTAFIVAFTGPTILAPQALLKLYAIWCFIMISMGLAVYIRYKKAKQQRLLDNVYLNSLKNQGPIDYLSQTLYDAVSELSFEDLQRLRFALDRALQPIPEFNGFEYRDQFQTAAIRYQINTLSYGISTTQARFTPACKGYLTQAQNNLLAKQTEHRVWSYWWLENLWGNLKLNANPLSQENIMYTGFVALQTALFAATGMADDLDNAQNFILSHPSGKQYPFGYQKLIASMEKEYAASAFCLIACEPNWIYPLCNMIGASALLAFDCQKGGSRWQQFENKFRHALETEFLDGFGHYVPCWSARTGLALPSIGGIMPLALPCFFLNAIAPDLALRQWLLLRRSLFDGQNRFKRKVFWRIDTGNYGFSRASAYASTALAAAELGDVDVYEHCLQALEDECPSILNAGVIHRKASSVWAHGIEIMARSTIKDSFRNLIHKPLTTRKIYLDNLEYPEVLVAAAHAGQNRLDAVLYPGFGDSSHQVHVGGLSPNQNYTVKAGKISSIQADIEGKATIELMLKGRTELKIQAQGIKQ